MFFKEVTKAIFVYLYPVFLSKVTLWSTHTASFNILNQ